VGISEATLAVLDVKFAAVLPHLDERQRRLYLASEAAALGHSGITAVAAAQAALDALDQLAVVIEVVDDLGPVARRALRGKLRRTVMDDSSPAVHTHALVATHSSAAFRAVRCCGACTPIVQATAGATLLQSPLRRSIAGPRMGTACRVGEGRDSRCRQRSQVQRRRHRIPPEWRRR
jgi:hypothetical protein